MRRHSERFLRSKCSCKMLYTQSIETFVMPASSRTFTRRLRNTEWWIFLNDLSVTTIFRRPKTFIVKFWRTTRSNSATVQIHCWKRWQTVSKSVETVSVFIFAGVNSFKRILWLRHIRYYPFYRDIKTSLLYLTTTTTIIKIDGRMGFQ